MSCLRRTTYYASHLHPPLKTRTPSAQIQTTHFYAIQDSCLVIPAIREEKNTMYGSYGSYSSMSSLSQPLDIGRGSYLSSPASYHQSTCAYPSWPRQERPSSYLSDDDLLDFEEDSRSYSPSSNSSNASGSPFATEEELLHMQREQQAALQREALLFVIQEKERRKQAAKRTRRSSSGSAKKSPKSKTSAMASISETVE